MPHKILSVTCVFLLLAALHAAAQTHLSVDVRDPVYRLLEVGELKGAVNRLSAVKPYSRSEVLHLLEQIWGKRQLLTPYEQRLLADFRQRFGAPKEGLRYGNVGSRQNGRSTQVGADLKSSLRVNVQEPSEWHLDSSTRAYLRGDLVPWLSYEGSFGITLDRVRAQAFLPYEFTKEWDARHVGIGPSRYSVEAEGYPVFSYDLGTDITAQFLDDTLTLRMARLRRDWGLADGSLTLSSTARPFLGVEVQARPAPWLAINHLSGSLSDWEREPQGYSAGSGTLSYQKLFTLQRLELFPFPWLYASASSYVIGPKRFELGYAAPLMFSLINQNAMGDLDNVAVAADLAFTFPPFGRLYFSGFGDELEIFNLAKLFTRPRNMFALQAGLKAPIPGLPFTTLTFQYTKVEPFTYAHYPMEYPLYDIPVEGSYTHDRENLATRLWPNSDELLVSLWSMPLSNLRAGLEYRLVRHGDNPSKDPGDLAILGRPEAYLDYGVDLDAYPDKDFLHDGLYDFNHMVTLSAEYDLPSLPITLGLSYSFSYTFWEPNASGEPDRPDQVRNILRLKVTAFR